MKCVVITVTYMVELQDRVLAPWGPSSISAVAELVFLSDRYPYFKGPSLFGPLSQFLWLYGA